MTEPTPSPPTQRRRWFQFSLRSLLLMMLVVGCGLGWLTMRRSQSKQAWKRIADAEELGISFNVIYHSDSRGPQKSLQEEWLDEWLWVTFPVASDSAKMSFSEDPQAAVQELRKYPHLKDLELAHIDNFTDEHLACLSDFKNLTLLYLHELPVEGSGLAHLHGNTSLEILEVKDCENLADEAIYSIPKLPSLTQLTIENCPLTGISLGHLATACPKLEKLILVKVPLTIEGLQEIGAIHSLKSLTLAESDVTTDGLGYLNDLTQLQEIHLYRSSINDVGLEHLSKHPLLENLPLLGMSITDAGMAHLSVLHELKEVDLEQTGIGDQGLQHIQSQKLESLRLNYTLITDAGASQLTRFPRLRILELGHTKITDACIPELAKLPQLEVLMLGMTAITDEALSHFSHHKTLKALTLPQKLKGTPGVNALQLNNPGLEIRFL